MAYADYQHCEMCDAKAFYDADLDYDEKFIGQDGALLPGHNCGDMKVLCRTCAQTHRVVIEPRPTPTQESHDGE